MVFDISSFWAETKLLSDPHIGWKPSGKYLEWAGSVDVDYVTLAGVRLRMSTFQTVEDRGVTIQLEYHPPSGKSQILTRIDWRQNHIHNNKNLGPEEYKFIIIDASHIHPFSLNWRNGDLIYPGKNLPIAVPINPDPSTFQELLAFTAETLNMHNMRSIPSPPWAPGLI
jgi:hypothetical protein